MKLRHKLYDNDQYVQLLNRIKNGQNEFNLPELKNYQYKPYQSRMGNKVCAFTRQSFCSLKLFASEHYLL